MLNPVANISGSASKVFASSGAFSRSLVTRSKLARLSSHIISSCSAATFMGAILDIRYIGSLGLRLPDHRILNDLAVFSGFKIVLRMARHQINYLAFPR